MNKISTTSSDQPLLKVSHLSISYRVGMTQPTTLRDGFIELLKCPWNPFWLRRKVVAAVKDISFEVGAGERVGILGRNGSGKSSLCRAIAGRHGKLPQITTHAEVRALFGSTLGLYPELSGTENAELLVALLYPKLTPQQIRAVTEEALEFAELGERRFAPLKTYSDGMKARLYLSIVSSAPTGLLILDEAFSGADIFFEAKVSERLNALIKKSESVLFVSHSMEHVREVCTRVLVIDHGVKCFDGPTEAGIAFFSALPSSSPAAVSKAAAASLGVSLATNAYASQ